MYLVEAKLYEETFEAAEVELSAVEEEAVGEIYTGMWCLCVRASIRLAQGRAREAAEVAERAYSRSRALRMGFALRHAKLLLVRAEAFHALDDHAAAHRAIREAKDDLLRRAALIPDLDVRRSFLDNLPDHRRTLELARAWLGETGR